jgi:hypothetical protein
MKKVGILNLQQSNNYGAVLQAYALECVVESLGYQVETIDLHKSNDSEVKFKLKTIVKKITGFRSNNFEYFRNKYLKRTSACCTTNSIGKYDAVVVGSDQVWRPRYTQQHALAYFLSFADNNAKRISYAASFGVDEWEHEFADPVLTQKIIKEVRKFKGISVREDSGIEICKSVFGVDAQHVLDPTLLAGKELFERFLDNERALNLKTKPIVVYKLDADEKFSSALSNVEHSLRLDSENIYDTSNYLHVHEWLSKIKNAELVVTDSFHGVCFCILFNKQFVCVVNKERGQARLTSMLEMLDIKGRLVQHLSEFNPLSCVINYDQVNAKLVQLRFECVDFLASNLND